MSSKKQQPYIIVLGNEKGGTGKSTTAMHVIVSLLRLGYKVGTIDVDARQGTLSRYIENREKYTKENNLSIPMPNHVPILPNLENDRTFADKQDALNFKSAIEKLKDNDFIVIDTPGSSTTLSRIAHSFADTIITPLNDSFIDLDMLAQIDPKTYRVIKPSKYAETVWEQKKQRMLRDSGQIDWIVIRNRLTNINARNKEEMSKALGELSKRIGCRIVPGFSERVIFRELFLQGLTLLDIKEAGTKLSLSHISAKQELRSLIGQMNLPGLSKKLSVAA